MPNSCWRMSAPALASASRSRAALTRLKAIARKEQQDGAPLIRDPDFAHKLSALEADLMALEFTELRILSREAKGGEIGAESSILKSGGQRNSTARRRSGDGSGGLLRPAG